MCVVQETPGLLNIQLRGCAEFEPCIGQIKRMLLQFYIGMRVIKALLERPNGGIQSRDITGQGDQYCIVIEHAGSEVGISRFHSAPEFTPDIGFPPSVEAGAPDTAGPVNTRQYVVRKIGKRWCIDTAAGVGITAANALRLRIFHAGGDTQLGPCFHHAQTGKLQTQVLPVRGINQA